MKSSLKQRSFLFRREAKWLRNKCGFRRTLPPRAASWLYESKSLTARLRRHCAPCFKVRVLSQSWQRPFAGESKLLQQPLYRRAFVREVRLECNNIALIAARTIIPSETLIGAQRRLSRLGTRPLGEVIFCYPRLRRMVLELSDLHSADWSSSALDDLSIQGNVWGRRTLYSIGGPRLIVCEFFLPSLLERDHV